MSQILKKPQKITCNFCGKSHKNHSAELWEIHQKVIPKGEKIGSMRIGFGPNIPAKIVEWNADPPYNIEYIPIHMHCGKCGLAIGSTEVDNADVLNGFCTKCFCEETDQKYDSPFFGQSWRRMLDPPSWRSS